MATYMQIQGWVKINFGYTVKTCWIAHVKEICGLEPRIAPNRLDETERVNPCPYDKIDPIKRAFRYFGTI
ncbi:MAG: hypothetical protein HY664_03915 [Chloroflexi bacterium]|nr:hypothetical protein [Chloroflexota bacterium]